MNIRELEWFRDNVAIPSMQKLLDNTVLPDGLCCIDHLDISFFDGRSWGTDSEIKASGLVYKNGRVEEYSFEECDIPITDFAAAHKDCVFISDGKLHIRNELEEMEISSVIRNINACSKLFPELSPATSLRFEWNFIEYVKMQHLRQMQLSEQTPAHASVELKSYQDAILHLCNSLNESAQKDAPDDEGQHRSLMDYSPIFESTNYYGIYFYNGENEYHLVNKNTGEHMLVLGDSFEFVGRNTLDCMEGEEIVDVASKEILGWLVHYSKENAQDLIPANQLVGIAVLEAALASNKGTSLSEQIQSAAARNSESKTTSAPKTKDPFSPEL